MKKVRVFGISDIGCVRRENEDSFWVQSNARRVIALVADGMGGHVAGKLASSTAVKVVRRYLESSDSSRPLEEKMEDGMFQAHKRIEELAREHAPNARMGTTCTLAVVERFPGKGRGHEDGLRLLLGHVGDSRLYRLTRTSIEQLSTDHTMLQRMLDAGAISAAEASEFEHKNVIYKSLGGSEHLQLDPVREMEFHSGEVLLLCSDGLTGHVSPREIHTAVRAASSLERAGQWLVELAKNRGGSDNITIILLEYGRLPRMARAAAREQKSRLSGSVKPASRPWRTGTVLVLVLILAILGGLLAFHLSQEKKQPAPESGRQTVQEKETATPEQPEPELRQPDQPVEDENFTPGVPAGEDGARDGEKTPASTPEENKNATE